MIIGEVVLYLTEEKSVISQEGPAMTLNYFKMKHAQMNCSQYNQ